MNRRKIALSLLLALFMVLAVYYRPISLADSVGRENDILVTWIPLVQDAELGSTLQDPIQYELKAGSKETEALLEILDRYSYRNSLVTLLSEGAIEGSHAGGILHIYGREGLSTGGTGEILVGSRVCRIGLAGDRMNLMLIEDVLTLLEG
ncbi:MAG: hypothetical protein IJD21_02695 [Oscillospiraceae bacterium]|nr:hypothetical protein [Oscillospiraceae bacterium]